MTFRFQLYHVVFTTENVMYLYILNLTYECINHSKTIRILRCQLLE